MTLFEDVIRFELPTAASGTCPADDRVFVTCRPNQDYVHIEIQPRTTIPINSWSSVIIPSISNITLPALGIAANQQDLLVTARARDGNIPLIPFTSVLPVGSFGLSTVLAFMPPRLRIPVNIILQFVPRMDIEAGEQIMLHLPRFSGPAQGSGEALSSPPGLIEQCSWSQQDSILTFTVSSVIKALDRITVTAMSGLGVQLPDVGLVTKDGSLLISSDAAAGPVLPVSIVSFEGVGGVKPGAEIQFTPNVPDQDVEIEVRIVTVLRLYKNDVIVLTLPGFTALKNSMDVNLVGNSTVLPRTARWVSGLAGYPVEQSRDITDMTCTTCLDGDFCFASTLSIVVQREIPAGGFLEFRILPSSMIHLPVRGFPTNDPALSIAIQGKDGIMLSQPFDVSEAVQGTISDATLSLGTLLPAATTDVYVSLTANIPLQKDFVVRVYLPAFGPQEKVAVTAKCVENPSRSQAPCIYTPRKSKFDPAVLPREYTTVWTFTTPTSPIESEPAGVFSTASWDPDTHALALTVTKQVPAATRVSITVPESFELRTPALGLRSKQGDIKIAVETNRGTSDAMPFISTPVVPALISSSRLRMTPATANTIAALQIEVSFTITLSQGDLINVRLPGFSGPQANSMPLVTASNGVAVAASWTPEPGILTVRISGTAQVPAGTVLRISVPADYGITVPPEGIPADGRDVGPTVSVHAPSVGTLNSAHIPFSDLPTIGAMLKSSVTFGNRVAGGRSSVTVSFAMTVALTPGDTVVFDLPGFTAPAGNIANIVMRPPISMQRTVRPVWPTSTRHCGLTGLDTSAGFASCVACDRGYYGRACSWYCDDMETCNGHLGRGFCNNDGACTCFYPFTGPFCNTTARDPPYRPTCKPRKVCLHLHFTASCGIKAIAKTIVRHVLPIKILILTCTLTSFLAMLFCL